MTDYYPYQKPIPNKWIKRIDEDNDMLECPKCGCRVGAKAYSYAVGNNGYSFCPYCGADLRKQYQRTLAEFMEDTQ